MPSWVSLPLSLCFCLLLLDLPASLERHKRRNQVARQAGSQLVTHFARIQSRRVSQVATVHLSPPLLLLLLSPAPLDSPPSPLLLHDYRASIFAKLCREYALNCFAGRASEMNTFNAQPHALPPSLPPCCPFSVYASALTAGRLRDRFRL